MDDADYLHPVFYGAVEDDVVLYHQATEPWGSLLAGPAYRRIGSEGILTGLVYAMDKTVCVPGAVAGNVLPNFGKVSLR